MVKYKFNQPYYEIFFDELEEDAVDVLSFQGEEHISRLYTFKFELLSQNPELDPTAILDKKATFVLNRGSEDPIKIFGIISRFEQRGRTPSYVSYYAELVPKIWRLGLTYQSRVFQNQTVDKIVEEVLKTSGLSGQDFEFNLNESYPELEYVIQYRETDFNFINRWLEHFGIFYYFDHKDDNDVIIFTDSNDNIPAIEQEDDIFYNPNKDPLSEKETISELTHEARVVTGLHQLKDYNYRFPSTDLKVEQQIDSEAPGTYYEYGDHYKDTNEGDFLVNIRNQETLTQSKIYQGKSDCRLFRAGYKYKMGEHYRDSWNEPEYILYKISSRGTQRGLFSILPNTDDIIPTYENRFQAIPMEVAFRPQRITPKPRINGIMNAKVDAGGDGEYAEIDDQGRYKVILPFDLSGKGDGEASRFIRMAQPYSGPNYGIHFPLHKSAEVILTFMDGDPDRPIIASAVPNPETASPVSGSNQSSSVIRTGGDNEFIIEDSDGSQQIHIHQACDNEMLFDAASPKIEIKQACGNEVIIEESKGIKIQDSYGNLVELDSAAGTITLSCPSNESKIVLGKSVQVSSVSNYINEHLGNMGQNIAGKCDFKVGGDLLNFFAGIKNETIVGAKSELLGGIKNEIVRGAVISNFGGVKCEKVTGVKFSSDNATEYESVAAAKKEKAPNWFRQVSITKTLAKNLLCNIASDMKFKTAGKKLDQANDLMQKGNELAISFSGKIYNKASKLVSEGTKAAVKANKWEMKGSDATIKAKLKVKSSLKVT